MEFWDHGGLTPPYRLGALLYTHHCLRWHCAWILGSTTCVCASRGVLGIMMLCPISADTVHGFGYFDVHLGCSNIKNELKNPRKLPLCFLQTLDLRTSPIEGPTPFSKGSKTYDTQSKNLL